MKINDIISASVKPDIYEKGTAFMWTDEHISKQILDIHLNPDIDLGSRKKSTIEKTANWILDTQKSKGKLNILDLGCGPGLYTEIFAREGHSVTGVDISKTSIDYAKQSAAGQNLEITYINANYLDLDVDADQFDLVVMLYTDLGVLFPDDRKKLLSLIYKVLKRGGTFIFDVLRDNDLEKKTAPKTWEATQYGFWKDMPYLALSGSFLYEEHKVVLFQHLIADSNEKFEIYRFWTHFFSQDDVNKMLIPYQFREIDFRDDILPEGDIWNGDNVLFCMAKK